MPSPPAPDRERPPGRAVRIALAAWLLAAAAAATPPETGTIVGTVTAMTGEPIAGVLVQLDPDPRPPHVDVTTGLDGRFRFDDVPAGHRTVEALDLSSFWERAQTRFPLAAGETATVDFVLSRAPGGAITGTVEDRDGEPVVSRVVIRENRENHPFARSSSSDALGRFRAGGLPESDGGFFVVARGTEELVGQLYPDVPCPHHPGAHLTDVFSRDCDVEQGEAVFVGVDETVAGIGLVLQPAGAISGRVTTDQGEPLDDVRVRFARDGGTIISETLTGADGGYAAGRFLPGAVYRVFTLSSHRRNQLYDGIDCPPHELCDPALGTPVTVQADATTTGIDFALRRIGAISGRVTNGAGRPIRGARVDATSVDSESYFGRGAKTDADGRYLIEGLLPGRYRVRVEVRHYGIEYWDDHYCRREPCPDLGDAVEVASDRITPDVDFALRRLGTISGRVTSPRNGRPLRGMIIRLWWPDGMHARTANTDHDGEYRLDSVNPGVYFASVDGYPVGHVTYRGELYDDIPCLRNPPEGCDPADGTPIPIGLGENVQGIDFSPSPLQCFADDHALCFLFGDRFEVRARWATADAEGVATAVQLTEDSGAFFFFREGNLELMVKMLDGCDSNGHFWVFATGLTNVEVELTVTDTRAQVAKEYFRPAGPAFVPVRDLRAFDTCDFVSPYDPY